MERASFWREFIATTWDQRVALLHCAEVGLDLTADDLFRAFVLAASSAPEAILFNREIDEGVYSRHATAPPTPEELPRAEDLSFEGYAERVTRLLAGGRFCIRLVNHAPAVAERVNHFLRGLGEALGKEPRVNLVAFVGNYDFTPVGVHTDEDPIFQAVVLGKKRARFWPREVWEREPRDPHAPDRYLADAESHALSPGQIVFWPARRYHVFECAGLAGALSIGLGA
jgi:50S ribosomal protein L16 3-hydroxylase